MQTSRVYITEGIVLKRRTSGEADRIVTIFTKKYGKIHAIAKGIRKITSRRAGHLEPFTRVMLSLHKGNRWDIITEAQTLHRLARVEDDFTKMGFAFCMIELVDQLLPERQEHEDVYVLFAHSLEHIADAPDIRMWQQILSGFIHDLLRILGYLPQTTELSQESMQAYVEKITERKFRTWPLRMMFA